MSNMGCSQKHIKCFDKLPICNTILWKTLIAGYVDHGHGKDALKCSEHLQSRGVSLDATITLVCSLKACGSVKSIDKALVEIILRLSEKGFWKDILPLLALLCMPSVQSTSSF